MKRVIIILIPLIFAMTGCGDLLDEGGKKAAAGSKAGSPEVFTALEWNAQALFDGRETGSEYREYLGAAGWTAEKYAARITAISRAVLQALSPDEGAAGRVPDLIGFVEIENAGVLDDLAGGALAKYGYRWSAFSNIPGAALGLGVLSRFPITDTRTHSITAGQETAPRPVLEVRVESRGKPLVFLLCHWKSKLGDAALSAALRNASARVVQRRLRELKAAEAETPVVVMGDLNETYENLAAAAKKGAAVPAVKAPEDFLVLSAEKPPRPGSFPEGTPALYSPWGKELKGGSYYYRGEWESIDHFLLSHGFFDGSGWDFADCRVLDFAPFTAEDGSPDAYIPRFGRGLSDHLPLVLYLRDAGE